MTTVRESVQSFAEVDSPIAATIHTEVSTSTTDVDSSIVAFEAAISPVQSAIKQSDSIDDVYAAGLGDGVDAIKTQISGLEGQLGASRKVIAAGAGPHKAAEYLQNARTNNIPEAIRLLKTLDEFVTERGSEDEAISVSAVHAATDDVITELNRIDAALQSVVERLTG